MGAVVCSLDVALNLSVERARLHLQVLKAFELGGKRGLKQPVELFSKVAETVVVGFGQGAFAFGEDMTVAAHHP